jgi:hypothetical protein
MPISFQELERAYHKRGERILELEQELEEIRIHGCSDPNHRGIDKLIHTISMSQPIFPDDDLGPYASKLAMIIQAFFDSISERKANAMEACTKMREIIKAVHGTTDDINSLKVYRCKDTQ